MNNQPAKMHIKRLVQRTLPSRIPPLIVASMGRSGSTMTWNTLRHAVASERSHGFLTKPWTRLVSEQTWDLDATEFIPGIVYKTHGLAEELPENSGAKVVFLFGSATDAALSVLSCESRYGPTWIEKHFQHLRASGGFEELLERDVLRFSEQLDGWISKKGTPRIILRYESLWDHEAVLSDFVGVPIKLPPKRPRNAGSTIDADTRARYAATYAALDAKILDLPDCQVLT